MLHCPATVLHYRKLVLHHPASIPLHPAMALHRPASILLYPAIAMRRPASTLLHPAIVLHRPASILLALSCALSKSGNLKATHYHPHWPMSTEYSIATILNQAQVAIDNALSNPDILGVLKDFGYNTARIEKGKFLYNTAAAAQLAQTAEAGEQVTATATVNEAWDTAKKTYMRFVKIARIAFKRNPGATVQLDLSGSRKRSLSGWLTQANQFYKNALASKAILKDLKEFGVTEQKLKAGLDELNAVEAANLAQEKEKGEAQAATKKRDSAIDELQEWVSDYLAIAKIALEDNPQLLEGLGVLARS